MNVRTTMGDANTPVSIIMAAIAVNVELDTVSTQMQSLVQVKS